MAEIKDKKQEVLEREPLTAEEMAKKVQAGDLNPDGSLKNRPRKGSGLDSMINSLIPQEDDDDDGQPSVEKVLDDEQKRKEQRENLLFDKLTLAEDKKEKFSEFVKNKKDWTEEDLEQFNFNDEEKNELKSIFPKNFTSNPKEDFGKRLEDMEQPALIDEVKKNQRLVTERNKEIETLKTKIAELEKTGSDSDAQKALKLLNEDFVGNYDKVRKQFGLPSIDLVAAQINSGGIVARLKQYQDNVLRKQIEQKYNLSEGEFEYDPKEASEAGTPSFDWDFYSDQKKEELLREQTRLKNIEAERLQKVEKQQKEDIKWYADKYFDGNEEEVNKLINEMNEITTKVAKGEEEGTKHPFALRNLLRGFYHDKLVEEAVNKAVENLQQEYAKHNMYLPGGEHTPTDLTKIKRKPDKNGSPISDEAAQRSPMLRSLRSVIAGTE